MSYEANAFRRVMVDLRWCSGLGNDLKEQIKWVEDLADSVFNSNAQRAGQGRHPLNYEEIRKKVVAKLTQKGRSESILFSTSGLYSSRSKKEQELEKKLEKANSELKALKERNSKSFSDNSSLRGRGGAAVRGRGGGRGGQTQRSDKPSIAQKILWTCVDWNAGGCSEPCPKGLKHACSFVDGE